MKQLEAIKHTLLAHSVPDVNAFVRTEMVLAVFEKYAPDGDASQAFLLLHNYALIGNIPNPAEAAFLQKAHVCLRQCSSKQNWTSLLTAYREDTPEELRFYTLTEQLSNGKRQLKLSRNLRSVIAPERPEVYLEHIRQFEEKHRSNYAKEGTYRFWLGSQDMPWAEVTLPAHTLSLPEIPAPKLQRDAITVTIPELLESAKEMQSVHHGDYCYDALRKNQIKAVDGKKVIPAQALTLQEAVNLVGMVGAGKSTLMKVLSYHLAKQQKKVVLVLDTVADTLQMYAYFRKLHLHTSPLIGRGEREKYSYQVARQGEKCLDPVYSEYLTAPCLLAGMAQNGDTAPHFGKEPCRGLRQKDKQYTCPYLDICPNAKMYRDVLTADVIVTTVQGLAAVRLPGDNRLFLEYVLEQADLVMFDECDKVQKTLDAFFTPSTDFEEFIQNSANDCAKDMQRGAEQLDSMGENALYYAELRMQAFAVARRVRETVQSMTGTWSTMLKKTFSAMTLYRQLSEDSASGKLPLSAKALQLLETAMEQPEDETVVTLLDYALQREQDAKLNKRLKDWLVQQTCEPHSELIVHIKLYLIVTAFDRYVHSLEEAYSFLSEEEKSQMELFDFLQARFTAQQKLLPSAVMGNLFGMRNDQKKGTQLYRQYAFGRALMNRMPWLRLTEDGKPTGPHVLLLSGSSWAEGCLEYHVHVPVQYLLEAEVWKREKLSETKMYDLNTGIRVSGGGQEEREKHLCQVIDKSMDAIEGELNHDGKLLMIVNSYREARIAAEYLNRSNLLQGKAACMVRGSDVQETPKAHEILRGEVGSFANHSAQILVAPAQAIERGYNIVDEEGHSTFGSVFFLVRPMAVPDEISSKCAKLGGIMEKQFWEKEFRDAYTKSRALRREAAMQWSIMEEQSRKSLTHLNDTMKQDVTAGLFILILQIFGRLARITDQEREAPRVYFADGAFRTASEHPDGYDCLNELRDYLKSMMENMDSGEIAKTLYAPFYEAFVKGVNQNVYTDLSDGDDPEDEYFD